MDVVRRIYFVQLTVERPHLLLPLLGQGAKRLQVAQQSGVALRIASPFLEQFPILFQVIGTGIGLGQVWKHDQENRKHQNPQEKSHNKID